MKSALELAHTCDRTHHANQRGTGEEKQAVEFVAAAVWIFALGKQLYGKLGLGPNGASLVDPAMCDKMEI